MSFDAGRSWRKELDVRGWAALAESVATDLPNGVLRPVVGARRSGKTWLLRALKAQLPEAELLDLRGAGGLARLGAERPSVWLIDEPGSALARDPHALLQACTRAREAGVPVLIPMSPGEWSALCAADPSGLAVARGDRIAIGPLSEDEALALARRAPWGPDLLARLPPHWRRTPFLLELVLQVASASRGSADPAALVRQAIREAVGLRFRYVRFVFGEGLSPAQREHLRQACRGEPLPDEDDAALLVECGLLTGDGQLADPVLRDHLPPPVIIHHVSDVHFGRHAAEVMDAKDRGELGRAMAAAMGQRSVAHSYSQWIAKRRHRAPHLLVVSGDLVEWARPDELAQARAWLDGLQSILRANLHPDLREGEPRVLLVGGNHDVAWDQVDRDAPERRHAAFGAAMEGFVHPQLHLPPSMRGLVTVFYKDLGLEVALLGSSELGGALEPTAQAELIGLIARLRERAKDAFEARDEATYEAARTAMERLDPAFVADADLRALEHHPWRAPVRVAVLHHPLGPIPGSLELRRYAGLLNAGAVKDALLKGAVCLALHGHQHVGFMARESWPELYPDRELLTVSAPSLGSTQVGEKRGFVEISLRREGTGGHEITLRRMVQQGGSWEADGAPFRIMLGALREGGG